MSDGLTIGLGVWIGATLPRAFLPAQGHGGRAVFALLLGVALGVSALPVIARTLTDMRLLHRDVGQLILCAVSADDVAGWVLLAVVPALATSTVQPASLALPLGGLLGTAVVVVAGRPAMRAVLGTASRAQGPGRGGDGPLTAVVTGMILLSAAATQAVRLEAVIGAFACGLLIRGSVTAESDLSRLGPLNTVVMSLLAPLYFATAGLRMDLSTLTSPGPLLVGLVVLVAAICGKFAGAYVGGRASRLTHWEALAVGAGLNSRGVVEVIVAMTGLQLHVLTQHLYTIVVLVAIVTSLMAPPLLRSWTGRTQCSVAEARRAGITGLEPALAARQAVRPDAEQGPG